MPNHRIAAGTHATDGRLCSPVSSGPIAARTTRTFATTRPSGVPITTPATKPSAARWTDIQTKPNTWPSTTRLQNSSHTARGAGSWASDQNAAAHRTCQTTISRTSAPTGGRKPHANRFQKPGRRSPAGAWSESSPAPTASRSASAGRSSCGMGADHLSQVPDDFFGELLGVGQRHVRPLAHDLARPRRQQDDALPEPDGLAHVVGHEEHRRAGAAVDAQQLTLQDVAGDGIERG